MRSGEVERLVIRNIVDVQHARRVLRAFASKSGMPAVSIEELVLVASELGGNLVKHSNSGGELTFYIRTEDDGSGTSVLELQVQDNGPGIVDLERALQDGYSTQGTWGSGLPAVRRLADSFEIQSGPGGTKIRVTKRISTS